MMHVDTYKYMSMHNMEGANTEHSGCVDARLERALDVRRKETTTRSVEVEAEEETEEEEEVEVEEEDVEAEVEAEEVEVAGERDT